MKFLTFDQIKAHLRLDDAQADMERDLLEMYGESAEDTVLELLNRSYEDLYEVYGRVPSPVKHATLLLVDVSYQHRSPVSQTGISVVPYSFDIMLKPYMRLADHGNENDNENEKRYGCKNL